MPTRTSRPGRAWRRTAAVVACVAAVVAAVPIAAVAQGATDARSNAVASTPKDSASARPAPGRSNRKTAFSEQKLVALLPERIGDWKRVRYGNPVPETDHDVMPAMQAQYARGTERADVEMSDLGQAGVLAARQAASAAMGPSGDGKTRTFRAGDRVLRESRDADSGATSVSVVLANGLSVRVSAPRTDGAALQQVLEGIDLAGAEALRRSAR